MPDSTTSRMFALPDLGEGLSEAELLEWLVSEGDDVRSGQAIARVETDKAEVDVTSPWTGVVARLHGQPGDRLQTGETLVEFDLPEETDPGTVVGALPSAPPARPRVAEPRASSIPAASRRAVPAARARARTLGIALESIEGTGPEGVITRADVERSIALSPQREHPRPQPPGAIGGEPLRGVRLAMARNMARSNDAVAAATLLDEAEVEAWWSAEVDVMPRLIRALAAACAAEPALNAWLDGDRMTRILHSKLDLAIAIQSPDGLFAPVLRDVGRSSAEALRDGIGRLIRATRERSLTPADLHGATFTLSNFGRLGGRHAMLVIVPPQVAILGAGRIEPRVVAREGVATVRTMLPLSLSFDHRAVTGAEAAGFMGALRADLERAD